MAFNVIVIDWNLFFCCPSFDTHETKTYFKSQAVDVCLINVVLVIVIEMTYPREPVEEGVAPDRIRNDTATPATTPTSAVDPNIQQKIDSIKNGASTVRDISASIRDTVRALRESGAIDELIAAVHEATITMRDTTIEISKISRDLKERGMIKDTAKTLDETVAAANEAAESFRQTVEDMKEAAPQTAEVIKKARERVKTKKENK
jgi:methyl-accepting chemotaxis protein